MAIGDRIKDLRLKNNMTQQHLADKLFVTPQAVSRWEKNIVEPNISTILKLVSIFNISINDLLSDEE